MKKILVGLLVTVVQIFAEDECQQATSQVTSWKDSMMAHWDALSDMHKMIVYGLIILAVVWIGYRLLKCGTGGCGCGCGGNCNCHK